MKLTNDELEVLDYINCYNDRKVLANKEINSDEIDSYINDLYNWDSSITDFFFDWLFERIYTLETKKGNILYFFDNSEQEIDVDREELLQRVIDKYNIETEDDFNDRF